MRGAHRTATGRGCGFGQQGVQAVGRSCDLRIHSGRTAAAAAVLATSAAATASSDSEPIFCLNNECYRCVASRLPEIWYELTRLGTSVTLETVADTDVKKDPRWCTRERPTIGAALLPQAVRCMYVHACKTSAFRDGVAHSCKAHIAHPGIQVGDRLCQSIDAMETSIESRLTGVGKGGMTPGADPVL